MSKQLTPNQLLWVEALESGEYTQITGCLEDRIGNCCLGVACRVAMKHGVVLTVTPNSGKKVNDDLRVGFNGEIDYLPTVVRDWLGLTSDRGYFNGDSGGSLVDLNDDGETFLEIAEAIRANAAGLFV